MQRNIQHRLAIEEAEQYSSHLLTLEKLERMERKIYQKHLPKTLTIEQVAFLLDIPEKDIREKITAKEIKASRRKRGNKILLKREEVMRISNFILKEIDTDVCD